MEMQERELPRRMCMRVGYFMKEKNLGHSTMRAPGGDLLENITAFAVLTEV
jgi:hypothetical protein